MREIEQKKGSKLVSPGCTAFLLAACFSLLLLGEGRTQELAEVPPEEYEFMTYYEYEDTRGHADVERTSPEQQALIESRFQARILGYSLEETMAIKSPEDLKVRNQILKTMGEKTMVAPEHLTIPIRFFVSDDYSAPMNSAINDGIDTANDAFESSWFRFSKTIVNWDDDAATWISGTSQQHKLKENHGVNPAHMLNVFIVYNLRSDGDPINGNATYPWAYAGDLDGEPGQGQFSLKQGVLLEKQLVGFYIVKRSTFPHEIGHWLGLLHTFEDGATTEGGDEPANSKGDYCDDTPCQWVDARGCDEYMNTCDDSGPDNPYDPIGNLMTYITGAQLVANDCRTWFSDDQMWRMQNAILYYRYELLPDVTDLSESSYLDDTTGSLDNGWAAAHETITNSGTAIISPYEKVTAEVVAHGHDGLHGKIVLKPGFHAMLGSEFQTKITEAPGECSPGETKHLDCDMGVGRDWVCTEGHFELIVDDCQSACVYGNCSIEGDRCCDGKQCINGNCNNV